VACWTLKLHVCIFPEDGSPMPKHVGVTLITNFFMTYFIVFYLSAFVGQYIE